MRVNAMLLVSILGVAQAASASTTSTVIDETGYRAFLARRDVLARPVSPDMPFAESHYRLDQTRAAADGRCDWSRSSSLDGNKFVGIVAEIEMAHSTATCERVMQEGVVAEWFVPELHEILGSPSNDSAKQWLPQFVPATSVSPQSQVAGGQCGRIHSQYTDGNEKYMKMLRVITTGINVAETQNEVGVTSTGYSDTSFPNCALYYGNFVAQVAFTPGQARLGWKVESQQYTGVKTGDVGVHQELGEELTTDCPSPPYAYNIHSRAKVTVHNTSKLGPFFNCTTAGGLYVYINQAANTTGIKRYSYVESNSAAGPAFNCKDNLYYTSMREVYTCP